MHTGNGQLALQQRGTYSERQAMQGVGVYLERDDSKCRLTRLVGVDVYNMRSLYQKRRGK